MSSRAAVVTDSTSYIPSRLLGTLPIHVVPLHVVIGERTGAETTDITPQDVASALGDKRVAVTTSRPTPEHFLGAYDALLDDGVESIASVHISGELSGTWDSARTAAEERNGTLGRTAIGVVDSRLTCMGLGFAVLAAARCAEAGEPLAALLAAARRSAERTTCLFYVDTLEHLRRGGRIGAAQALVGTALAMKPLLHVEGGRIVPLEKVRTAGKALARLRELTVAAAVAGGADAPVRIAVQHLAAAERAEQLRDRLVEELPNAGEITVSEVGAVVGAHVGPGLLGVVVARD